MADDIKAAARTARQAALTLSQATEKQRNAALEAIAQALHTNRDRILDANKRDQAAAEKMLAQGKITLPLIKRLKVDAEKLDSEIIVGVHSVAAQEDPIGKTQAATELDEGLNLYRVTVPIGVIGVVFESRPDALVQIATLCLKSGNAVMLKGGSEAFHTNRALAEIMVAATADLDGIPEGWMHLLEAREEVAGILELHDLIDLIIPRGGNELVQYIMDNTKIPVMGHADGICHVYVDKDADLKKAVRIAIDSKTQYAAACNAAETLLVHAEIARNFFATAIQQLTDQGVLIRGDARTLDLVASADALTPVSDSDWSTEYLDYVLSVKSRRFGRRSNRPHQRIQQPPHRFDRNRRPTSREEIFASRGFGIGPAQCVNPICRRISIWPRRRSGHQHQPPAQPRTRRSRRSRHLQIRSNR